MASWTDGDPAQQRDAFARLFAQYDRWLFGYLVSLLGSRADAEEVFQELEHIRDSACIAWDRR